jgi:Flp pilus assembly pilin Flp
VFIKLSAFQKSEDGAVTVDWVVLTAAIVALATLIITAIHGPTGNVGDVVGNFLSNKTVD